MDAKALYKITYGLYLLTARDSLGDNGCIINTAIQIANEPARIAVSVLRPNKTCDMIRQTGVFNVCALTQDTDFALFQKFGMQSGRNVSKFDGFTSAVRTENGLLRLTEKSNMFLSARVVDTLELGSHTLFVGEITEAETLSPAETCTYGYYQSHIKPRPAAPAKKAWVCSVCGYVHEGEDLPEDFLFHTLDCFTAGSF